MQCQFSYPTKGAGGRAYTPYFCGVCYLKLYDPQQLLIYFPFWLCQFKSRGQVDFKFILTRCRHDSTQLVVVVGIGLTKYDR